MTARTFCGACAAPAAVSSQTYPQLVWITLDSHEEQQVAALTSDKREQWLATAAEAMLAPRSKPARLVRCFHPPPVSYTHLDVYKRQAAIATPAAKPPDGGYEIHS